MNDVYLGLENQEAVVLLVGTKDNGLWPASIFEPLSLAIAEQ